jgi:hypothetical protein
MMQGPLLGARPDFKDRETIAKRSRNDRETIAKRSRNDRETIEYMPMLKLLSPLVMATGMILTVNVLSKQHRGNQQSL